MANLNPRILFITFLVALSFLSLEKVNAQPMKIASKTETAMETMSKKEKVLRHVVLFKFNDTSSEEDVKKLNEAFNALPDAISVIKDFEWGINDSPENFHQDFTHCYLLTFASEEDRDNVYTPHPQHQAFVASLQPHVEKVFVVDYWTNP